MISFRNGLTLAAALSSACVLDDLTPAGKPCPCPATYTCDTALNQCVEIATASEGAGSTTGASASTSTGIAVCAGTCGTPGCSPCPEVAMIDGGLGYTIDATETPRGDYVRFLADAVDPATQGPQCAWNTSFTPHAVDDCAGYDPMTQPELPITCVDWCDAVAFCKWAGKHLCGKIGGGGTVPSSGVNDPAASEWYAACSAGGTRTFPYGDTYTAELCNEAGGGGEVFVGSYPGCDGGFPGLLDMVGNVEEWEDACSISATPEGDDCQIRGGGFWSSHDKPGEEFAQCQSIGRTTDRDSWSHDWGLRCCDTP